MSDVRQLTPAACILVTLPYRSATVWSATKVVLYLSNFAAFFDLSQAAIRVFGYFMTCMKPKNDLIIFNRKKCLEYTKYKTDKAVYKGLAELVKAEIIARGPADNLWFINPLIVFNGDRVTFAKTYVRKKTLAAQKKEEAEKRQLSLGFDEQ
ncbi:hypothetical protein F3B30_23750 [Bacteroides fragilis]|nr:hypothetical protein F3B30_23750 [Bacteroides fragilis]